MYRNILLAFFLWIYFVGCTEQATEPKPINSIDPAPIHHKVLKTNEVVFFSSNRDGKATNIFMITVDGQMVKKVTNYEWGEYAATAISPDSSQLLFYQAWPEYDIDAGMDIYIYKIKEDTIIGPITQGHPGNFSPDGNKFVFSRHTFTLEGGYESIFLYDLKNKTEKKLTEDGKTSFYPQISPDGNSICYESASFLDTLSCWQLHLMDINGKQLSNLTKLANGNYASNPVFSPDGQSIIFWYNEQMWCYDICELALADKTIKYLTKNRYYGIYSEASNYKNPCVSKSSNRVFFYSQNIDGQYPHPTEIYRINRDGNGLIRLTYNDFWDSHPVAGTVSYFVEE